MTPFNKVCMVDCLLGIGGEMLMLKFETGPPPFCNAGQPAFLYVLHAGKPA